MKKFGVEIGKEEDEARSFYRKKGFLKELNYSKEDRVKSCCGEMCTRFLWCEHWGGFNNGGLVVTKFHFPIILGFFIMSWFCSGQPNIRCVFYSPVFFLVPQPVDRIQTL